MTNKEKIQNVIDRMPENVTFDQAIYRMVLLKKVEIGLQQMKEGKLIDHDELFDRLLSNETNKTVLDRSSRGRPSGDKGHNRQGPAQKRRQVRQTAKKVSR